MSEELKIIIREERSGDAIREAEEDLRKLEAQREASSRKGASSPRPAGGQPPSKGLAVEPPRSMEETPDQKAINEQIAAAKKRHKDAVASELQATRQAVTTSKLEEQQLRASGKGAEADALGSEIRELETAAALQAKLGIGQKEALVLARESISAQAKINAHAAVELATQKGTTRQRAEQAALARVGITTARQVATTGVPSASAIEGIGTSMLSAGGGLAAAVTAALAGAFMTVNSFINQREKTLATRNRVAEGAAHDSRDMRRMGGILGSGSDAVSSGVQTNEEIGAREAHREELLRQNKRKWYNPARFLGFGQQKTGFAWFRPDSLRAIDENEQNIDRLKERRQQEYDAGRKKFLEEEGGLGLEAARGQSKHTTEGIRQRREAEFQLLYMREYKRLVREHATASEADEGAQIAVKEEQRNMQLRQGASLVNARSGAADIARAASIASQSMPDQASLDRNLSAIRETLNTQLTQLNENTSRQRF